MKMVMICPEKSPIRIHLEDDWGTLFALVKDGPLEVTFTGDLGNDNQDDPIGYVDWRPDVCPIGLVLGLLSRLTQVATVWVEIQSVEGHSAFMHLLSPSSEELEGFGFLTVNAEAVNSDLAGKIEAARDALR